MGIRPRRNVPGQHDRLCCWGAFLSLAYFDLPYNILVLVVLTKRWVGP